MINPHSLNYLEAFWSLSLLPSKVTEEIMRLAIHASTRAALNEASSAAGNLRHWLDRKHRRRLDPQIPHLQTTCALVSVCLRETENYLNRSNVRKQILVEPLLLWFLYKII